VQVGSLDPEVAGQTEEATHGSLLGSRYRSDGSRPRSSLRCSEGWRRRQGGICKLSNLSHAAVQRPPG
jgi:hypothetical protein